MRFKVLCVVCSPDHTWEMADVTVDADNESFACEEAVDKLIHDANRIGREIAHVFTVDAVEVEV